MEDAVCIMEGLPSPLEDYALFAVFDGHGGSRVSAIASETLPDILVNCAKLQFADQLVTPGSPECVVMVERALHDAILEMDVKLREIGTEDPPPGQDNSFELMGSTAMVALVDRSPAWEGGLGPSRVIVANIGDSRGLLCRSGELVSLSEDHKPEDPAEEARIVAAGGHVALVGPCHRVDGWGLNLSRALGDFHYKNRSDLPVGEQKVSLVPDICTMDLGQHDEFLVLCCDGVFELHTSEQVVSMVLQDFQNDRSVREIAERLCDSICSRSPQLTQGKGTDNCSCIVIRFGFTDSNE